MWTVLSRAARGLLSVVAVLGVVFVLGMRRKWAPVLNAVRRSSRASKGVAMRTAGTRGADASVVRHVGRRSGKAYDTPVRAVLTDDGFAIALPYGTNSDWLKNVLANGGATIVNDGNAYVVDQPRVVPIADVAGAFSAGNRRAHRVFGVTQCLVVRRVTAAEAPSLDATSPQL
jgi:deazaflavin-dependent oxidoreductase (nitroreductase family)